MLWAQIRNKIKRHIEKNVGEGINPEIVDMHIDEGDNDVEVHTVWDQLDYRGFRHVSIQVLGRRV